VGTLIFGAALMFVACVLFWRPEFKKQVLTVCALVGISATTVYGSASLSEATSHSEGYTLDMQIQGWSQRFSMWRAAYELYEEHPVAGAGLGNFKVHYPRFRTADDITSSGNFVHNDYVQFLCEGGPLMLLLLLLLVGYLCVKLWVNVVSAVQTGDGAARVLLITAMGTTLVHSLMNFTPYQLSVQMLFGLYMVRLFESEVTELKFTRPRLLIGGSIVAGLYFSAAIVLDTISSGIVYDDDQFPFAKELKAGQQTYFNTITLLRVLRPNTASNHFALATLYRTAMDKQSDPEKKYALAIASAFSYQRGLELNPFNYRVRSYLSDLLQEQPRLLQEALIEHTPLSLIDENVRRAPVYVEHRMNLADYLEKTGKQDEAYKMLVGEALPWANLRHARYQEHRLALYKRVRRAAIQRNDVLGLNKLLTAMSKTK
jgi:O-antigen ligase